MATELAKIEQVLVGGDLAPLSEGERVNYYKAVCDSLGLNPLTKPFDYIRLNGKLVLYAKRDATDQLRKTNGVSVRVTARETIDGVYVVTAQATDRTGRVDESTGAVPIKGLGGEALANAFMKAETKAKRRVTLSICGLGLLDETEVATVSTAEPFAGEPVALPQRGGQHQPADAPRGGQHTSPPGVPVEVTEEEIKDVLDQMEAADSVAALKVIGNRIREIKPGLAGADFAGISAVYEARLHKLRNQPVAA
jgi:hypothetical protein